MKTIIGIDIGGSTTKIVGFKLDGDKRELSAPLWSGDKKRVLNSINKALKERTILQGSKKRLE